MTVLFYYIDSKDNGIKNTAVYFEIIPCNSKHHNTLLCTSRTPHTGTKLSFNKATN